MTKNCPSPKYSASDAFSARQEDENTNNNKKINKLLRGQTL